MEDNVSIMSDNATLVEEPDTPTVATVKPCHSTRASQLAFEAQEGRCSTLEYLELTFSIMFLYNGRWAPLVVAISEDLNTLLRDVQSKFSEWLITSTTIIKELKVSLACRESRGLFFLNNGNMVPTVRLLKSMNGDVVIIAE